MIDLEIVSLWLFYLKYFLESVIAWEYREARTRRCGYINDK